MVLNWIYGTENISVSGNVGYGTVSAEEVGILIMWVGEPLPCTTANVLKDIWTFLGVGHMDMCTVLIGGCHKIPDNFDKGISGLGRICMDGWISEWAKDNEVTGGRRWWN
jgi:hypothetical protein